MRTIVGFALAVLLAGCATAPTNIGLGLDESAPGQAAITSNAADEAILIFAIGPIATAGGYQFQRLTEDKREFVGDEVTLGFAVWGVGDKMKRPEGGKSSFWVLHDEINFLIKKVEPGTYVASYVTWNTFNGVSSGTASLCRNDGAATFEIQPGINILSSRDAYPPGTVTRVSAKFSEADVLAQFEQTRQNYPDLKGAPRVVYPALETHWTKTPRGFFSEPCSVAEPGTIVVNRLRQAGSDVPPDDADKAAIAAAIANVENKPENLDVPGETD
ncbi:hypothetical protein [Hyphomonas oceanitis]|uniref:Lipoprotein n=1 Tax=Hyphomonas oceanitis SCH89 TaxID=1280953 RepID=A0A059GD43_9PROT|nr:hypothetical protein [Hyphomonas oceanitis]KDA04500.1 hypothetical protein HOC_01415 [Hyphomonas oceanitis SCH89]